MNTATDNAHIVTMSNTRSATSKHFWYDMTEEQVKALIEGQRALDNGVRVIKVWHSNGSVCQHDPARIARLGVNA
jgi:hypothetical protein